MYPLFYWAMLLIDLDRVGSFLTLTLNVRILQFLTTFTQDQFIYLFGIPFGFRAWSCKMCQTVQLKWGHTKVLTCIQIRIDIKGHRLSICGKYFLSFLKKTSHQRNWHNKKLSNFAKLQFLNDKIYKKAIWQFGKIGDLVNFSITKLLSFLLCQFLW